ncbi:acyl-CoA thioesterase [Bacillus sp. ISL-41]|uniref:acyl-CoA thioesterase n=1 Tax=Bacillus sp. ISL-41 TaxID=2819127 RepID=UPI001BEB32B7|nr:thioesterase family protein [Bacillus sp. ISL-41]MBT2644171.1 acyl-CoA thioesterase [Bacillus sp. ISL-41]
MQEIQVQARFGETDALGHINNTSYFVYLEEARMRFFEKLGYSMELNDWKFILASTKCDFVSQGYFDQLLTVKTYVSRIGSKSFQLEHDIVCPQTQQLIAKGNAIIVYYDFTNQQSQVLPELLKEGLKSYLLSA